MKTDHCMHLFGEVLFDHFPDGSRVLGGAPFNVAWHLQAFGQQPQFISRVGDDAEGRAVAALMDAWGLGRQALQCDSRHATGSVRVSLDNGEPRYDIVAGSAYDFIAADALGGDSTEGILYHGSLAIRNPVARAALQVVKARHRGKIFVDVNLRPPWWQSETLLPLLADADWVKLNTDELKALCPDCNDISAAMGNLCDRFELETLIVTCGSAGAVACAHGRQFYRAAPSNVVKVVDTVGAGDAFAAVLLLGLNREWPLAVALQRAQEFAEAMVGVRGATVDDADFYQPFNLRWNLSRL